MSKAVFHQVAWSLVRCARDLDVEDTPGLQNPLEMLKLLLLPFHEGDEASILSEVIQIGICLEQRIAGGSRHPPLRPTT